MGTAGETEDSESESSVESLYQDHVDSDESMTNRKQQVRSKKRLSKVSFPKKGPSKRKSVEDNATSTPQGVISTTSTNEKKQKKPKASPAVINTSGTFDIVVPSGGAESLLFVQLDGGEDETSHLEGAIGAIGRLEQVDDSGVFFDIQGIQYSGKLLPGPSMLLLSQHGSNLRLEGVTDDFVQATCTKSRKGIDVGMSSTFARCDEDVNTTREVIAEIKAKNMK